ncbi:TonB-dependent receptor [Sulfurimonas lithotrophica]|uniref:TonB-dependent receptor n=1 Tax=Sulfurimonas lithotrophica TaxID=2590022 RepID=A0A5P8P1B6_9BACT|nr:TonB-dependent receptor [Sulfurimonas lithotrophica]QFR49456.1 TonB-dependent receptor [Sulfurimonas lithotrophica]
MKKITAISVVCAIAISTYASDLGTIKVESSTIDDKFETKKSEISSTTTVSGEKVDKSHISNIQQILQSIPGITTESSTGDSLKIHLRGVENQMYMGEKPGVAVVIDGVPVFERTGKVNIDLDNIESIKVIKGGASYLFGDDALSGAVIITTKRGAKYNHNYGAVEVGSYGYKKAVARTGYANDDLSFHVQASQRSSDGYHEDSDYETSYLNGKLQYYIDDSSDINVGLEYSKREKDSHGTVGGETQAKINPESIYTGDQDSRDYTRKYDVELMKAFLTYSKDFDYGANLLVNTYIYTDTTEFMSSPQTKDSSGNNDATLTDDNYVYDNHYEQVQKGVKSEYRDSFKNSAALLGVDLRANEYENKTTYRAAQALVIYGGPMAGVYPDYYQPGDFKSNDKTDENVYALYGEYKYAFTDSISATTNLRYDKIKLDYTDSAANSLKKDFSVYSYRIGMNYQMSQNSTLFLNYSTGFRAPTISQLFAGDVSTWGSTQNNPNLDPEESFNYEIGVRALMNNIKYEASVFQIDRKDFIMKTSGNYGDTDTNDMWDNVGGARHRGFELSAVGNIIDSLSFNMAYTYLRAKYTNYRNFGITMGSDVYFPVFTPAPVMTYDATGNTIPRTSKHNVNLIMNYQVLKDLTLMAEVNAKSKYYADDLNKIEIAGHGILNLMATYNKKLGMFDTSFFVRADNVFDKQYYTSARSSSDRNEDGVFNAEDLSITVNPGRVLTAGLAAKF